MRGTRREPTQPRLPYYRIFRLRVNRQTDRQTDRQTGRQTDRQTDRHTRRHRQTDRQTERQIYRQTDRQIDKTDRPTHPRSWSLADGMASVGRAKRTNVD